MLTFDWDTRDVSTSTKVFAIEFLSTKVKVSEGYN